MSKQVKVYTTVTNRETGETVNLSPGDTPPDWAVKVLGDHVYVEDGSAPPSEPVAGPGQAALSQDQLKELEKQLAEDAAAAEADAKAKAEAEAKAKAEAEAKAGKS